MQAGPPAVEHAIGVVALQLTSQVPALHVALPVPPPETGAMHTLSQLPQWLGLLWVSIHWAPHAV